MIRGDERIMQNIFSIDAQYEEYLIDESKYNGFAESISFPKSEQEIKEILETLRKNQIPVTIQGGKTGIVGGAVPQGGHIMNLSQMNRVKEFWMEEDGTGRITVEPGINLIDLSKEVANRSRKQPVFFPADPTETSASIGGVVASGAQGISRVLYGNSREYIAAVKVMDYNGNTKNVCNGQMEKMSGGSGKETLDFVFGKEGITGILTEITLKLLPKPMAVWGIAFFFMEEKQAAEFIETLKEAMPMSESGAIAAVEYIDQKSLALIQARKESMTKIKELPDIDAEIKAMVYIELHGAEEGIEELAELLMERAMENDSDVDAAWAVSSEADVERLHAFRHAAAETVNLFIEEQHRKDKRITKLGMDMLLKGQSFWNALNIYEKSLQEAGLKGCVFGHALDNHLHVNILPESYEDYQKGIEMVRCWAKETQESDGILIGEHGVGKLKKKILKGLLPADYLALCQKLKEKTDKECRINRGNII